MGEELVQREGDKERRRMRHKFEIITNSWVYEARRLSEGGINEGGRGNNEGGMVNLTSHPTQMTRKQRNMTNHTKMYIKSNIFRQITTTNTD